MSGVQEPSWTPQSVPWGMSWDCGNCTFRVEEVHVGGRYLRTEAYVIQCDGSHNPIGHFSGSTAHCLDELRRIARWFHCQPGERCVCQIYPDSTCHGVRAFLAELST